MSDNIIYSDNPYYYAGPVYVSPHYPNCGFVVWFQTKVRKSLFNCIYNKTTGNIDYRLKRRAGYANFVSM